MYWKLDQGLEGFGRLFLILQKQISIPLIIQML